MSACHPEHHRACARARTRTRARASEGGKARGVAFGSREWEIERLAHQVGAVEHALCRRLHVGGCGQLEDALRQVAAMVASRVLGDVEVIAVNFR